MDESMTEEAKSASTGGAGAARTIVTLDGPAGVGKSTTARAVAEALGYCYLDSGSLYRAVTYALLEAGIPGDEWDSLSEHDLAALEVRVRPSGPGLELSVGGRVVEEELRTPQVNAAVSLVARVPAVRGWLLNAQRSAGDAGCLVADGRDMGTVVFPDAWAKIFLKADVTERARRRLGDQGVTAPTPAEVEAEAHRLAERDRRDSEREVAPLKRPDKSLLVDTTDISFEDQVGRIAEYARRAAQGSEPPTP